MFNLHYSQRYIKCHYQFICAASKKKVIMKMSEKSLHSSTVLIALLKSKIDHLFIQLFFLILMNITLYCSTKSHLGSTLYIIFIHEDQSSSNGRQRSNKRSKNTNKKTATVHRILTSRLHHFRMEARIKSLRAGTCVNYTVD